MKKSLLSLALLALTLSAGAQTLYTADFKSQEEFDKWTIIDANEDGTTWKFDDWGSQSYVFYNYSSANTADDWFISPAITPTKDGRVMVSYGLYGDSYIEKCDVYSGTEATVAGMTTLQTSHPSLLGELTSSFFMLNVKAGEPFRVGFHCVSEPDRYRLYLVNFSVQEVDKVVDLKVSDVLSPASGKDLGQETVSVRIKNEGTDPAEGFDVGFKVNDGEATTEHISATLAAGESMDYTFTAKADLSEGPKTHTIKAFTAFDGDVVTANDTTSVKIRNSKAVVPPYSTSLEPTEDTEDLLYYNLNEDDGDWSINASMWTNTARTGYSSLVYNYNKENAANDWVIFPPMSVEEGTYVLRYWYSAMDDRNEEKMAVYWGTGNTPDDMTNLLSDYTSILGAEYREGVDLLTFDKAQTIYFGFKAKSDANKNWLCLDDISFYKASSDNVDFVASSIDKPFEYVRTPNNKDVEFEVRSVGIKEASAKVTVSIDGTEKYSEELTLAAQEHKSLKAEGILEGLEAGKHTITLNIASDIDDDTSNNTLEKEITVLGEPVLYYDFEDGELPADFTYFTQDEGTINSGAGEEFNEYGWGIINIQEHQLLGQHLLGGTSWLDGTSAANRWVILPQIHVNSEDAVLVWDANSGNDLFLEDYYVKASDGSGVPTDYYYSTFGTFKGESTTPKTRGVTLGKNGYNNYVDKDVWVAFNLVTQSGDFLCLDNIGIYGDVVTGIEDVHATDGLFFDITGGAISTPDAQSITILDLSGRTIQTTSGPQASVESLKSGVYMAVIKTATTSRSIKFVKK